MFIIQVADQSLTSIPKNLFFFLELKQIIQSFFLVIQFQIAQTGIILGGEQSGHIIFSEYSRTGDGLLTAIMLMTILVETKTPLSVLASEVTMYPQVLKNVEVDDKASTLDDAAVKAAVDAATAYLGSEGRVLLRASGTEPVLRVMSEASTYEDCEKCVDDIIKAMKDSNHLVKVR